MQNPSRKTGRARGFTLIELLVVIAIIGLLSAALLPNILSAVSAGDAAAVEANLKWHHQTLLAYKTKYSKFPSSSGVHFVTDPWVRKDVEHTQKNFERYWSPFVTGDPRKLELEEIGDFDLVWETKNDVSRDDTHYAGPDRRKVRDMYSGKSPLMASHTTIGPALRDGTTIVLTGDGSISKVFAPDIGFDPEVDATIVIGDDSPHELLQKLTR